MATNTRGRDFYLDPALTVMVTTRLISLEGSTPILMFAVCAFGSVDLQRAVHQDPAIVADHRSPVATRLAGVQWLTPELTLSVFFYRRFLLARLKAFGRDLA